MNAPAKAGRYALTDELGRGAMGVVYRAEDPVIGRAVAVKTVRLDAQAAGMSHDELLRRFQTEARAAGRLTHPNIVVVYDAGEDDGLFYITMELVEGRSLQELLTRREAFPISRVLRIMQQACAALDFAHQNNVVHRDIKPANLMLTPDDTLKITDFGTAKILKFGTVQTAQVIGTPSYMSPEQIKGRPVDGRSDVFSLGVVLYELVTGEKPFPGDSVTTVIYKIVNEDPVPPRQLDSSIPAGLSAVITRALAKAPVSRFHTCREFMDALQNYRDFVGPVSAPSHASLSTKPRLPGLPALQAPAAAVSTGQRSPLLSNTPAPKQGGSIWVVLVLLAIIGGAGYRIWPALQEIWHRSQAARTESTTPLAAESQPASPPEAAALPEPVIPAAPASQARQEATTPEAAPIPAANISSQPVAEEPLTPAVATAPIPAIAEPQRVNPSAPPAKDGKARTEPPRTLLPTSAAISMQRLIESTLVGAGVNEKIQVTAVGNSVTLTGKLSPQAHSKLVSWLQKTPTRVQIIDDIEYAEDSGPSASGGNAIPF